MTENMIQKPWEDLREILEVGNVEVLSSFLHDLSSAETARSISRLSTQEQSKLLIMLEPDDAADVIESVSDTQAADMIEELPADSAAAIVDEITSDRQADLLAEMDKDDAEAILGEMSPDEAEDARKLLTFDPDNAGGLMVTEYLAYRENDRVRDVLKDLQLNRDICKEYNVQYMYVLDRNGKLTGVLRIHDLLLASDETILSSFMLKKPISLAASASIRQLKSFFDDQKFFGVPIVDDEKRLLGIVLPEAVEIAALKQADRQFLGLSGIVGGEEFRTMPLLVRSGRRFSWLSINIVLNIIAASVIAYYQETLSAVIALAVFLPIISGVVVPATKPLL
ncbi:magnesium transporter [Thermodesulfobacteriota bacterium]